MTVAFRSAQEVGYATGTSIAFGTLASLTAGDRMYAVFYVGGSVTVTTPAGWSQWFSPIAFTGGGSPYRVYGFYKTAAGTETTQTFSWTGSLGHGGIIFAYSGVDASTQFDATTVSAAGSSASLSAPTMTTVTDNAMLVWIGVLFGSFNGSQTPPSGMTKRYGSPSGQDYLLADEVMATHGATGAKSITVSSGPWIAVMAALRPASTSEAFAAVASDSDTATGTLLANRQVAAVASDADSASGALLVHRAFAAVATDSDAMVGQLLANRSLTATASDEDTASGSLLANRLISATATDSDDASGTLQPNRTFAGIATDSDTLTGSLLAHRLFAGIASDEDNASGSLTNEIMFAGIASDADAASGTLLADRLFAGIAADEDTASGALLAQRLLAAVASDSDTATGTLTSGQTRDWALAGGRVGDTPRTGTIGVTARTGTIGDRTWGGTL